MVKCGRPTSDVVLTDDERETLERWQRRPKNAEALAQRCRIVLACAEAGVTNSEVAARLGVTRATVSKWRRRFAERRLDGLHDDPRPGVPRKVSDDDVERVIVKTLEETPLDATHWSTRSMAKATGVSRSSIGRIWSAFGLKPHLSETFKLSPDPLFIERSVTSWASTSIHLMPPSCCASTRRPRYRLWTARLRYCGFVRGCPSVAPTTTNATGPLTIAPPSTSARVRSSRKRPNNIAPRRAERGAPELQCSTTR